MAESYAIRFDNTLPAIRAIAIREPAAVNNCHAAPAPWIQSAGAALRTQKLKRAPNTTFLPSRAELIWPKLAELMSVLGLLNTG
jgi:hypothetical protein